MMKTAGSTLTYVSSNSSTTATTAWTFASQNIGNPTSDRVVVVALAYAAAGVHVPVSGISIGGVAATLIAGSANTASGNTYASCIYALLVPAGTTASIVISASYSMARCGMAIYALNGTGGIATPHSTGTSVGAATNPEQLTLSSKSGGAAVWAFMDPGSATNSMNAPAILDAQLAPAGNNTAFAHVNNTGTSTTFADIVSASATVYGQMVGACW